MTRSRRGLWVVAALGVLGAGCRNKTPPPPAPSLIGTAPAVGVAPSPEDRTGIGGAGTAGTGDASLKP